VSECETPFAAAGQSVRLEVEGSIASTRSTADGSEQSRG
jgi:hypothetical protein